MRRPLTLQEKQRVQRHPLYVLHSGQVPDELWPQILGEEPAEPVKRGRKANKEEPENGDGN